MTITKSIAAKLVVALVAVAMAFAFVAPSAKAQDASSMSLEELIALVNQLQAQLAGGASMSGDCTYVWTRSLTNGSTGVDVQNLQVFLNMSADTQVAVAGAGSPGMETTYFGPLTAAAVSKFQTKYSADILVPVGLTSPTGYFGPSTMAKANSLCASMDGGDGGDGGGSASGDLEGGAGSVDTYELVSGLANEEVGEGEDDVEVMGVEIEASEGSDLEITALKIDFDLETSDSGDSDDFDDYASEVSVWFDGEEVARVDADEFTDDNNYSRTLTLDRGVIIRSGDTEEVTVAVSGASNIDSGDLGNTWDVDVESVRFRDAMDVTISEDPILAETQFTFESFASAADVELKVTSGDDDINDARAIEVDASNDTENVELFSFNIEAEGNSDLDIDDVPVDFTSVGAGVGEIINTAELWVDGELIASESVSSTTATTRTVTFDNIDWVLDAGDEVEVVIKVDVNDTGGAFGAGDTLMADVNPDDAGWDVEDEEGNDLAAGDKSGSATSDAHAFFEEGINVELVSATASAQVQDSADNDTGVFTMVFDITAFGDTVYVDETPVATTDTTPVDPGTASSVHYVVYDSSSATTDDLAHTLTYTTPSGVSDNGVNIAIEEDRTTRVTLTVTQTNDSVEDDGIYYMEIVGISFGAGSDTEYEFMYTFDLDEFETNTISLN